MTTRVLPAISRAPIRRVSGILPACTGAYLWPRVLVAPYVDSPTQYGPSGVMGHASAMTAAVQIGSADSFAQGYVKVQNIAVCREVVVLRRDTKTVIAHGSSGPNGFFRLTWKGYAGKVVILILEDEGGGYNAKIFDLVTSN